MKNNKNTIITLIVIFVGFFSLILFSKIYSSEKPIVDIKKEEDKNGLLGKSSKNLAVENSFYDFGSIKMKDGKVKHEFKIKNQSSNSAEIESIYTSCMCTSATLISGDKRSGPFGMPGHGFVPKVNEIINAGTEAIIEVEFDPAAHGPSGVGRIERVVFVEEDNGSKIELRFAATVTP